jgi:hypothetical protein
MTNPFIGTHEHEANCVHRHAALLVSLLLAVLTSSATALAAGAASINNAVLTWTAPTTNTNGSTLTDLTSFNVYHGPSPTAMLLAVTLVASARTFEDNNLSPGIWYWYITTVNAFGVESAPSPLVSKTTAPSGPSTTSPANPTGSSPGTSPASTTTGTIGGPGVPSAPGAAGGSGASGYAASDIGQHRSLCRPHGMVWCSMH